MGAPEFMEVQAEVAEMIRDRVLVGHAIHHDLKVLFLDHPKKMIRDTSKYKPFKEAFGGRTPGNQKLLLASCLLLILVLLCICQV